MLRTLGGPSMPEGRKVVPQATNSRPPGGNQFCPTRRFFSRSLIVITQSERRSRTNSFDVRFVHSKWNLLGRRCPTRGVFLRNNVVLLVLAPKEASDKGLFLYLAWHFVCIWFMFVYGVQKRRRAKNICILLWPSQTARSLQTA
jgi:hypothetical protein